MASGHCGWHLLLAFWSWSGCWSARRGVFVLFCPPQLIVFELDLDDLRPFISPFWPLQTQLDDPLSALSRGTVEVLQAFLVILVGKNWLHVPGFLGLLG